MNQADFTPSAQTVSESSKVCIICDRKRQFHKQFGSWINAETTRTEQILHHLQKLLASPAKFA